MRQIASGVVQARGALQSRGGLVISSWPLAFDLRAHQPRGPKGCRTGLVKPRVIGVVLSWPVDVARLGRVGRQEVAPILSVGVQAGGGGLLQLIWVVLKVGVGGGGDRGGGGGTLGASIEVIIRSGVLDPKWVGELPLVHGGWRWNERKVNSLHLLSFLSIFMGVSQIIWLAIHQVLAVPSTQMCLLQTLSRRENDPTNGNSLQIRELLEHSWPTFPTLEKLVFCNTWGILACPVCSLFCSALFFEAHLHLLFSGLCF